MTAAGRSTPAPLVARAAARLLGTRFVVRAPIALYRAGLGAVFGSRLLLLEHTGRISGRRRRVVLEVVGRPGPDRYVVVSGFGERAQWFRNVTAHPHVRVSVGRHRDRPATAYRLDPDESAAVLRGYARRHPRAWSGFRHVLAQTLGSDPDAGTGPPLVELRLGPSRR